MEIHTIGFTKHTAESFFGTLTEYLNRHWGDVTAVHLPRDNGAFTRGAAR